MVSVTEGGGEGRQLSVMEAADGTESGGSSSGKRLRDSDGGGEADDGEDRRKRSELEPGAEEQESGSDWGQYDRVGGSAGERSQGERERKSEWKKSCRERGGEIWGEWKWRGEAEGAGATAVGDHGCAGEVAWASCSGGSVEECGTG